MRRLLVGTAVFLLLLGGAGYVLFQRHTASFPELTSGTYVGLYTVEATGRTLPWGVVKDDLDPSLAVFVGDVRIPAQRASIHELGGKARLPLIVGGADARLRFAGEEVLSGEYAGVFLNPLSDEKGTWTLRRIPPDPIAPALKDDLTRWFALWQELDSVEGEIQKAQQEVDERTSSVDNLRAYVTDEETLKKTADQRLGRADSELDAARAELSDRQAQLDRAIRDFELTERISPQGKLVFLSREAIQRDSRWIELTLKLLAPETSPGFHQAVERAQRIKELKRKIAEERDVAVRRGEAERYGGDQDQTDEEEAFYGQLQ
jgi:hypothetical protein